MRGKFIVALAAGLFSVSAIAQTDNASGSNNSNSTNAPSNSVPLPGTSSPQAPGAVSVTPAPAPAAGTGTSTASLSDNAPKPKKRRIKGEIYNYNEFAASEANYGKGAPYATNFLGVKYALSDTQSIGLRQTFEFQWPKSYTQGQSKIEDMYINYTDAKLATFGDVTLTGIFRVYLPTGETSRFVTGNRGTFFNWMILSYSLGKFDFNYHLLTYLYNQSKDEFDNDGTLTPNRAVRLVQFPEVNYNIADNLSFSVSSGTDNSWYKNNSTGRFRQHVLSTMATLTYAPISQLSLSTGFSNDTNIFNPKKDFAFFREEELTYFFLVTASL